MPQKDKDAAPRSFLQKFSIRSAPEENLKNPSDLPTIPRFQLIKKLGEGGMASVYLAKQESNGRMVAIKIMSRHLLNDSRWADRFLDEAHRLAELSHPNIVPVFDWGMHDGIGYIVMEHIKGGDLYHHLHHTHPTIRDALEITRQIALGLDFAGEKGYIHRDIKPENILFREDGSPCILDFGIAKQRTSTTTISGQGIALGTGAYISPEQAHPNGRSIDARSDLYSLGVVFYEMLCQKRPFEYCELDPLRAFQLYLFAHINLSPPPLPAELHVFQGIIDKLLAKNPDDRFGRGIELRHALSLLEAQLPNTFLNCRLVKREESPATLKSNPSHDSPESHKEVANEAVAKPSMLDTRVLVSPSGSSNNSNGILPTEHKKKTYRIAVPGVLAALATGSIATYFSHEQSINSVNKKNSLSSETHSSGSPNTPNAATPFTIAHEKDINIEISSLLTRADTLKNSKTSDLKEQLELSSIYERILILSPANTTALAEKKHMTEDHSNLIRELIKNDKFTAAREHLSVISGKIETDITTLQNETTQAELQAANKGAVAATKEKQIQQQSAPRSAMKTKNERTPQNPTKNAPTNKTLTTKHQALTKSKSEKQAKIAHNEAAETLQKAEIDRAQSAQERQEREIKNQPEFAKVKGENAFKMATKAESEQKSIQAEEVKIIEKEKTTPLVETQKRPIQESKMKEAKIKVRAFSSF